MTERLSPQQELLTPINVDDLIAPEMSREFAENLIKRLRSLYGQPNRHYHNFNHIFQTISFLRNNMAEINNPRVVLWATLYHDAVYETDNKPGENEIESARMAVIDLFSKLPIDEVKDISDYINATANHDANHNDSDLLLFLDADMSILGSNPDEYIKYANNIRKEYSWVSDDQYISGRTKILQSFLNRKNIFLTDAARDKLEKQARENIQFEIELLSK